MDIWISELGKQVYEVTFNELAIEQILYFVQVFETRAVVQEIKVNLHGGVDTSSRVSNKS